MISMAAKGLGDRLSARLMPACATVATAIPAKMRVSELSDRPARKKSRISERQAEPIAIAGSISA